MVVGVWMDLGWRSSQWTWQRLNEARFAGTSHARPFPSRYLVGVLTTWSTSTCRPKVKTLPGSIGDQEMVQPVIVVPGWYVKPKGNCPVKVMNAKYPVGYAPSLTGEVRQRSDLRSPAFNRSLGRTASGGNMTFSWTTPSQAGKSPGVLMMNFPGRGV
jgi:hypothetical protein